MQRAELAGRIEHTLLKPEATPVQVDQLCEEAIRWGFYGVCISPIFVARARRRLEAASAPRPRVISVAGFPSGTSVPEVKVEEARRALWDGAEEIDMVAPIGLLLAGDLSSVRKDIAGVSQAVHSGGEGRILKVILETSLLTEAQMAAGCRCCAEGEVDFVKTSTGFHPSGGATVEAVRMLHRFGSPMKVKAAGGIRDLATALAMLEAGAERIGTSWGVGILEEWRENVDASAGPSRI